jgi:hypothetical protein
MSEDATLRDSVVVEPEVQAEPKVESKPEEATELKTPQIVQDGGPTDAELGRILRDAGYSTQNVNNLFDATNALGALRYAIQNDPQEFLRTLERADPRAGERFLETMADTFLQRYGGKETPADKGKQDSVPNAEVESLKERLARMENERTTERQQAQIAVTRQRYEQRVDDLFNIKEVKDLGLTKADVRNMRARVDVELGRDQAAASRATNGNFVDVPKVFQGVLEEYVTDKKAAQQAEKERRETQQKGAFSEFQNGPNPFMNVKLPDGASDSWDATENALAAALSKTAY